MTDFGLAAVYSLATAVSTGTFAVIVGRGGSYGNAVTGVLIGLLVIVPPLALLTWVLWIPEWWNPRAYLFLAIGGLLGPAVGRVLYFSGIHYLGVARSMPLASTMPLFASVLGIGLLGERPGWGILAGTVMIVAGCVCITRKKADDTSWNRKYIWLPIVGVIAFSFSHVFRKMGVEMVDSPLVAITVMSASGIFFLLPLSRLLPPDQRPQLRRPKVWAFYSAAGALNGVSVLFHFYGLRYGDLTIVTPLSSTAPLFSLALSWLFLKGVERVTVWILGGTILIVIGGGIVTWNIF